MKTVMAGFLAILVLFSTAAGGRALAASRFASEIDVAEPSNTQLTAILGEDAEDRAGWALAAGDVNGDGDDDLVIGAYSAVGGRGVTYVLFGSDTLLVENSIDLASLTGVLKITGDDDLDWSGFSLAVGNVNGDSYDDIIIGVPRGDPAGGINAGEVYVVYGSASARMLGTMDLSQNPSGVTRFHGAAQEDRTGFSVGAGDINGDGIDDIIIGAYQADPLMRDMGGVTYLIYGFAAIDDSTTVELAVSPIGMTKIYGEALGVMSGYSVCAGDFSDDGIDDIAVTAPASRNHSGCVYVIEGDTDIDTLETLDTDEDSIGVSLLKIYGAANYDSLGIALAAGDIDADGRVDLIIGAPGGDAGGGTDSGTAYVLFGSSGFFSETVIHLGNPPAVEKLEIYGREPGEHLGNAFALGDLNRDGRAELAMGAKHASPKERPHAGTTYILWGKNDLDEIGAIDLSQDVSRVCRVYGAAAEDFSGSALAIANLNSDIDGDLVIGAPLADSGAANSGGIYVFPGFQKTSIIDFTPGEDEYVSSETDIRVYFNSDITTVDFTVTDGARGVVEGSTHLYDYSAGFSPSEPFTPGQWVSVNVTAEDMYGVSAGKTWLFNIKDDEHPPLIVSRSPGIDGTDADPETGVTVTFTSDVVPDSTTATVKGEGDRIIAMTASWSDSVLILLPASGDSLRLDEQVTVTIDTGDRFGDRAVYEWSFTTRPETDPPIFTVRVPGSIQYLPKDASIDLVFPADIDTSSVETILEGNLMPQIEGTWAWSDTVYTFEPSESYKPGDTIVLTVNARDIHGNAVTDSTVTFTVKGDEVPPSIVARSPEGGAVDVEPDADISIEFTMDVVRDSTWVVVTSALQDTLSMTGTWIDYTVTLSSDSAFAHGDTITVDVDAGDRYTNRMRESWSFVVKSDFTPPRLEVSVPGHPDMMGTEDAVTLVFPGDIDASSVNALLEGSVSGTVPGNWTWVDTTYVFSPDGYALGETLTLTVGASDIHGNSMADTTLVFTVKPDETPPSIVSHTPGANTVNVPLTENVVIEFSGDVAPDSTTVTVRGTGQRTIAMPASWEGSTLSLSNDGAFREDETITVIVDAGDVYSNRLYHQWSFSTGSRLDITYFAVTASGDTALMGKNDTITVLFSTAVDLSSVNLVLTGGVSGAVEGGWTWSGYDCTFTPAEGYAYGETLLLTVNADDIHGNAIPGETFTFTVKGDETPPSILSRSPSPDDVLVNPDADIVIEFSDDVAADSTTVTVTGSTTGVLAVQRSWEGSVLTITHGAPFPLSETVTVDLSVGDSYANRTGESWSFTVKPETDPPVFHAAVPYDPGLMRTEDPITLVFPQDVDREAVSAVLLGTKSGDIPGEWAWSDTLYVFTPAGYTPGDTLTLTVNASDIHGNAAPEATFTFRVKGDETPPAVISHVPSADEIDVHPRRDIVIQFTDDVEPDSTTVTVTGSIQGPIGMEAVWNGSTLTLVNDHPFRLDETVSVSVDAGDAYANRMTASWSFKIKPDTEPPAYEVEPWGEPDRLAANSPVTIAFPSDVDTTSVHVEFTGSESGDLAGDWRWHGTDYTFTPAEFYRLGEKLTLTVEAADLFGNIIPENTHVFTVGEHAPWLVINSVRPTDPSSFTYTIDYTFGDPDSSYTKTRNWMYSIDGGEWRTIPEEAIGNNTSKLPGEKNITWRVPDDLSGVYSDNVRFRMEVFDGLLTSGYRVSPPFVIDRNQPAGVTVDAVTHIASENLIRVIYRIFDSEYDAVSLYFEYSVDDGMTWRRGEPVENLSKIPSQNYGGTFNWNYSGILEEGVDYSGFMIRLTPFDFKEGARSVYGPVEVDLNKPPSVVLDDIYTTQSGDVTLAYHITDAESDTVSLKCCYSIDGGETWLETANVTGVENITVYDGSILWHSKRDVPSVRTFTARFRVIPWDRDPGAADETEVFQLFNNGPPEISLAIPGTAGNEVPVLFTVTDAEGDPVTLHVSWSADGMEWNPATILGDTLDIERSAYTDTLFWDSVKDAGKGFFGEITLRVIAADDSNPPGSPVLNHADRTFVLDNEPPRFESVWTYAFSDTVYFAFSETVIDTTALDASRYSLSAGLTVGEAGRSVADSVYYIVLGGDGKVPFERMTLTARGVSDPFGNRADEFSTSFIPEDNNDNPEVVIREIEGKVSGNVTVKYDVTDTEGDTVSLTVEYSIDGGETWFDAAVSGALSGITPEHYSGEFTWLSAADIPGNDVPGVLIRVTAADMQTGTPAVSDPFRVDNNDPPSVSVAAAGPDSTYSGSVELAIMLDDAERDTLRIDVFFSTDGGETYDTAAVSGKTRNIVPEEYAGAIIWDSGADLPDGFGSVLVKVVPFDNDEGAADSLRILIDNFGVCSVAFTLPDGEVTGDIPVSYTIIDSRNREVSFTVDYSIDGGKTWNPALTEGAPSGVGPEGYRGVFTWRSSEQLEGFEGAASLRITPDNGREGKAATNVVTVDYNEAPSITVSPLAGEFSGDVPISYVVADGERNTVGISAEYSIDGGVNWYAADLKGNTIGIPADGTERTIVWLSGNDLPGKDIEEVRIRITAFDADPGNTAELTGVHIDNNAPPSATLSVARPDSFYDEYIDVNYVLSDDERNMLAFRVFYSIDGGASYSPATVTGKTSGIFFNAYASTFRWETAEDITEFYGSAVLKLLPSDVDEGIPDSLKVMINTFGTAAVALDVPAGVHEGDVAVNFDISDEKGYPVSLGVEYSTDGGRSWNPATVEGNTGNLPPEGHRGSFLWKSSEDLGGYDGGVLLRVTPDNGAPGIPAVVTVVVDYNEPPAVEAVLNDTEMEYTGDMTIFFRVSDPENDPVSVTLEYSTDDGATYEPATVPGDESFAPGTPAEMVWKMFRDVGHAYKRVIYIRLTPADNDPGESFEAGPFTVTNLVGDFSFDLKIDGRDLPYFIDVWRNQDVSREIGPVKGTPPALTVEPDGAVDFEDLAAFVWMWNWYTARAAGEEEKEETVTSKPAENPKPENAAGTAITVTPEGNGTIRFTSSSPLDYLRVLVIPRSGGNPEITATHRDYWENGPGIFLTRSLPGGTFETAAARFGDAAPGDGRSRELVSLHLSGAAGDIRVVYGARIAGKTVIEEGETVLAREEVFTIPAAFALMQNSPNPFNPSTTISYALPRDTHVRLTVHTASGQLVAVLKDEFEYAGNHTARWNASGMANGVYMYTLRAGDFAETRKMLLLK